MTIRSGQPSRKSPSNGVTKFSAKGMDVVMMNDFEQRHLNTKSRSHSPFGHIGSPTTPLNFEQLFLQGQLPLSSELSQHEQAMLQAQLLNGMRTSGMAPKAKQQSQPSLAMLDQLRQAYNRGEAQEALNRESQEHAEIARAAYGSPPTEPSSIALLQQKFAQMERHKAEMQKSSATQPQQVQIYPSQWPMTHSSMPPPPPPPASVTSAAPYPNPESTRHFYSFQPQQQVMAPPPEVPDQFFKQDWRPTTSTAQESLRPAHYDPSLLYMKPFQQPKPVEYQQFAVPPPPPTFNNFQLNSPPAPEMGLLGSVVVSSRCDKTGGHSLEIKSVPDHYRSDDSEMSLDNFSSRIPQAQVSFGNSFHMLPQSSKSAFSTFTRTSSNLNPAPNEVVVTKSLLFNDTYRRSTEVPDIMHDDVDTELHL